MVSAPQKMKYRSDRIQRGVSLSTKDDDSMSPSPVGTSVSSWGGRVLSTSTYDIPKYLIDVTVLILKAIRADLTCGQIVPYDNFLQSLIHNIFVISKLSHSVLLAGLLYLLRFRYLLGKHRNNLKKRLDFFSPSLTFVLFLSSMSLASKFHLDATTHNRRWSDNSGISVQTINRVEGIILEVIEYKLSLTKATFEDWVNFLFSTNNLESYKRQLMNQTYARRLVEETPEGMADLLKEFERCVTPHHINSKAFS